MKKVIVIEGPTASGKTAMGIALAKAFNGEVISADSMQIYKFMDIGTAKPTAGETNEIPHHMVDVISPFEDYSVSRYVEDAVKCAEDIFARGKTPIIVGGTGLYIESFLSGREFADNGVPGVREEIEAEYDTLGGDEMLKKLAEFDPESAAKLFPNDKRRIIRAFEIYRTTGKTKHEHDLETQEIPPRYEASKILLTFADRADLYERINLRVDKMMVNGLLDEVKRLLDMGLPRTCTAMQAIGYKEIVSALIDGTPVDDAVEKIKLESRRYAKRQLSWFRRDLKHGAFLHLWNKEPNVEEGIRKSTEFLINSGYNISVI